MFWALCVVLTVSDQHRHCIEKFPQESICWSAAADWTWRARAWTKRSDIHLAVSAMCLPPSQLSPEELNAFKRR